MSVKDIFVDIMCENEYQVNFNYISLYNANSTNFPLESTKNHTTFYFYSFFFFFPHYLKTQFQTAQLWNQEESEVAL